MAKICVMASVLVLAGVWAGGASAEVFTLNEALSVAYETNPQLDAQRASLRATDENVAQANAGWRPTINIGGSYGYENFGLGAEGTFSAHPIAGQVTVTEPIFRGGRTYAEIGRAKALVRAGEISTAGHGTGRAAQWRDRLHERGPRFGNAQTPGE